MNMTRGVEKRPTAGLRGASWDPNLVPGNMQTRVVPAMTVDGAQIIGYLHHTGHEQCAVMIMHPRELLVSHYIVPHLIKLGVACWVQGPRTIGNDLRLEHETALLDVAAGVSTLRHLGFPRIVLLGNSGGASLFAFYNQQSLLDKASRLSKTPGGRPSKLAEAVMPPVDGFIFIAPHPGQGQLLLNCIDPSVADEGDPLSAEPALDPFASENGFQMHPAVSKYTEIFISLYRDAQRRRVERITESAQEAIGVRLAARARSKKIANRQDAMAGSLNSIFVVWRTDADLRCFDLTLDPSDRRWGTVWGADPVASNLGSVGFGRVCTPESWLSTWSAVSSNASFDRCGSAIEQPTLMIYYTGDNTVFPSDAARLFESIGTTNKTRHDVRGNHHGHSLEPGDEMGQDIAGRLVGEWLQSEIL